MKKMKLSAVNGTHVAIDTRRPVEQPRPPTFTPDSEPREASAAPPMNKPVGPPPPDPVLPTDFEGFVELSKRVSRGAMTDKALLWASLANASALKEIAGHLDELLDFLGARDETEDDYVPTFSDQISSGIMQAIDVTKTDVLGMIPDELKLQVVAKIKERVAEAMEKA